MSGFAISVGRSVELIAREPEAGVDPAPDPTLADQADLTDEQRMAEAWALAVLYRASQPEGFQMELPGFDAGDVVEGEIAAGEGAGEVGDPNPDRSAPDDDGDVFRLEQGRGAKFGQFLRKAFIGFGATVAVVGYVALADLQITLNGSESLPEAAYLQWHWPKHLWRGAVVAFPPPPIFKDRLVGYSIVKRIGGLPGDPIRTYADFTCVAGTCYPAEKRESRAFAPLIPGGVIPEGMVAVFGEAPNSLDSRYASFGLVPIDKIEAVGIALRGFPRWQEIATWLGVPY